MSTSLQVFRSYIQHRDDGSLDVSGVVSRDCYLGWLRSKQAEESDEEAKKFHRTLTNHVSGVDGRNPFTAEEEAAILVLFRAKQPWPCFPDHFANVGKRYRSKGFHEKRQMVSATGAASSPTPPQPPASPASSLAPSPSPFNLAASPAICPPLPPPAAAPPSPLPPIIYLAPDDELNTVDHPPQVLSILSPVDAEYVKTLGQDVARNFGSPEFGLEDWVKIQEIFRMVFLSRTSPASAAYEVEEATANKLANAQRLCREANAATPTTVIDWMAKEYVDRILAQNQASLDHFGQLVGNPNGKVLNGTELYRVVLAVLAAIYQPGSRVCVQQQRVTCRDGLTRLYDTTYHIDVRSLLFVLSYQPLVAQ